MEVYLLYIESPLHSKGSEELLCVADELEKCYRAAIEYGASEEQVEDLRNMKQSQCSGKDYEFSIETWEVQ